MAEKDDARLLADYYSNGDKEIIGELFQRYAKLVLGACAFYFEDKENAKDAVMQIFSTLPEKLKQSRVENFKGWLSFVVRNHCISEIRKNKSAARKHEAFYEFELETPDEAEERRIASVNDDELIQLMHKSLPKLKEKQRLCVELFYLKEKSYQEISAATGYSLNEVKSYIQNGKRKLKLMIEEEKSKIKLKS